MTAWPRKPINSVIDAVIDYRGKTPPKSEFGIPTISARHVKRGRVEHCGERFVSQETYDQWTTRGLIKPGDVLITTEAPVGEVARVPSDRTYLITRRVIAMQIDPAQACERFVMYSLIADPHRKALANLGHGSTVPRVFKEDILDFEIPMPGVETQRRVGSVLGSLDDLIENNRRRIEVLEEMARLLYREWFVHFRFPGHGDVEMVDSDLGPIPEGWEVSLLGEACSLVMGQSPRSEYYNDIGEGLPFHQGVTDFGSRFPTHTKWTTVDKRVAEPGDVLFSVRAPVGRINVASDRLVVGRGLSAIRAMDGNQNFLLTQLKEQFAVEDSIGGGTIFNAVTKKDMESIQLLKPISSVVEAFEAVAGPMADLIANLCRLNLVLRETRDLLLPRLVSGELDVSELDVGLEAVGA